MSRWLQANYKRKAFGDNPSINLPDYLDQADALQKEKIVNEYKLSPEEMDKLNPDKAIKELLDKNETQQSLSIPEEIDEAVDRFMKSYIFKKYYIPYISDVNNKELPKYSALPGVKLIEFNFNRHMEVGDLNFIEKEFEELTKSKFVGKCAQGKLELCKQIREDRHNRINDFNSYIGSEIRLVTKMVIALKAIDKYYNELLSNNPTFRYYHND